MKLPNEAFFRIYPHEATCDYTRYYRSCTEKYKTNLQICNLHTSVGQFWWKPTSKLFQWSTVSNVSLPHHPVMCWMTKITSVYFTKLNWQTAFHHSFVCFTSHMSNVHPASRDTLHFSHFHFDFTVIDDLATGQTWGSNVTPQTKATLTISYPLAKGL
jgi:hypothetical protein